MFFLKQEEAKTYPFVELRIQPLPTLHVLKWEIDHVQSAIGNIAWRKETVELLGRERHALCAVARIVPSHHMLRNSLHHVEVERRTWRQSRQVKFSDEVPEDIRIGIGVRDEIGFSAGVIGRHD